jgi:MFS family permease
MRCFEKKGKGKKNVSTFSKLLPENGMSESSKQQFLSYVVAIYSAGQFIGSLFFGFWSNRRRTIEPLLVSLVILVGANMYYGFAQDFPVSEAFPRQWHAFISRFLVGFGAGNVAVARAFVSEGSTMENRNMAMTITGAAQGMGFVIGPAVGFALTLMGDYRWGPIAINGYTTAGFASALFSLINMVLIPIMFRDIAHKGLSQIVFVASFQVVFFDQVLTELIA